MATIAYMEEPGAPSGSDGYATAALLEYNEDTGRYVAYTAAGLSLGVVGLSHIRSIDDQWWDTISGVEIMRVRNNTATDKTHKRGKNEPRNPNFTTLNCNAVPVEATSRKPVFDSGSAKLTVQDVYALFDKYGVDMSWGTSETAVERATRIANEVNSGQRTVENLAGSLKRLAEQNS